MQVDKLVVPWVSMIVFVVIVAVLTALAYNTFQCKGECTEGNKRCQKMCFKRGHCPYEVKY